MRWPGKWSDPSLVELLHGTPVNFLLVENAEAASRVKSAAESLRLPVTVAVAPPAGVEMVKGDWPGTKAVAPGENERAAAGPTGEPWIDSNGWKVKLAEALHPGREIWVDAAPAEPRLFPESYVIGVADAAAHGGRWAISLDNGLAAGIAGRTPAALNVWKGIMAAAAFFAKWRWPETTPAALLGVVSNFTGDNEFLSQELLNLLARGNQQIRVLPVQNISAAGLAGLRAVIYADGAAPALALRQVVGDFVERGGLLVTGAGWGAAAGSPARGEADLGYDVRLRGKGRVATARKPIDDPYVLAQDAIVLVSHRHDLVRLWNGGAVRACLSGAAGGKRGLLQLVFYANARAGDATVRVAGAWRTAKLFTLDATEGRNVPLLPEKGAVEIHLPPVAKYAAIQLDV
jgi:hypothetical protein